MSDAIHTIAPPPLEWSIADALETYSVPHWGKGYFSINDGGNLVVHPTRDPAAGIDLKQLVDSLGVRGLHTPVLLRFPDILRERIRDISESFQKAIEENEYQGDYSCVFPIKVNQQRHIVEEIATIGAEYGFGLEAGSKPELLAVLAMTHIKDVPIVCNGFKDDEFIEMVILAQKIGKTIIPVVEKYNELKLIVKHAEAHGVRPKIGIRVKLSSRGAGKWEASSGARSKFGLFVTEVLEALEYLRSRDMGDCLNLLHFHLGSQITDIRSVKSAVTELARVYTEMRLAGAGLTYLDIGGGLGVDYDGSQTASDSSMNYTLDEYAADVVYRIKTVCDEADVPHPTIISESGRALVAYSSALVFDVIGATGLGRYKMPANLPSMDDDREWAQPLIALADCMGEVTPRRAVEAYHDAVQAYEEALALFGLGHLSLSDRGLAEQMFWRICNHIHQLTQDMERIPEELEDLPRMLSDIYFCNFSLFQSMPDSWAIDQVFPIMPIHRLHERPTRQAILADMTCDSDGKISSFTDLDINKATLELHELDSEPYYVGAFLVGAYQETLGDLHNLFGDTHAVHVAIDEDGEVEINHVVKGDTVRKVLGYVQYNPDELYDQVRKTVERAVKQKQISLSESAQMLGFYENGLEGYTYFEGQ